MLMDTSCIALSNTSGIVIRNTCCMLRRKMSCFRPIIDLWGSRADLAADIRRRRGTVQQWWHRDAIPPEVFDDLEAAARARGFAVDKDRLFAAHRKRWGGVQQRAAVEASA
jgi:hypothetical protein